MTIKDVIEVFMSADSIHIEMERKNPFRRDDVIYETLFDGTVGELVETLRELDYEEGCSVEIKEAKLYIDRTTPKMSVIVQ